MHKEANCEPMCADKLVEQIKSSPRARLDESIGLKSERNLRNTDSLDKRPRHWVQGLVGED